VQKATFGQRAIAAIIDWAILLVPSIVLAVLLKSVGQFASLLIGIAYAAYFEGTQNGQTPGKKMQNIRVVPNAGGQMDPGKAIIRYICKIVSSIPCGLGYWWMLWDKDKQTWHDKLSSTSVVAA
jgi:uncharacterized RDD family membrane protein YckC